MRQRSHFLAAGEHGLALSRMVHSVLWITPASFSVHRYSLRVVVDLLWGEPKTGIVEVVSCFKGVFRHPYVYVLLDRFCLCDDGFVLSSLFFFFAAAMANLRPQNFPLSAIYRKFYYFSLKNLSFHHFLTQVIFKSDKAPKVSSVPFFYFLIILIVLKLPVCFKLLYWKLPSLLQLPAVTLHLNRVCLLSFDAVIYTACCYCYFNLLSLPVFFSLVIDSYGQIPLFKTSIYNLVFSEGEGGS